MKTICFYFQIHQPYRLKRYRFFNIGGDHYYYDDFANEDIMQRIATDSFVPANRVMLDIIRQYNGAFKFAFAVSGIALEQMEVYAPEVIDGLKELADTGCVEFLAETYGYSLASLTDPIEFEQQVLLHKNKIESLFGLTPTVFHNTESIFSDEIADAVYNLGYKCMVTEGAKRTLGWKSPNYLYQAAAQPKMKLLLRNSTFSEDISMRFSNYSWNEYPLTADKYINWIADTPKEEQVVNLFMNYETFGNFHKRETGIFDFMKVLPRFAAEKKINFAMPSEVSKLLKPAGIFTSTHPISWIGEEKDISPWMGNILQQEAFKKLYSLAERVRMSESRRLKQDWLYLQSSDHFYYMGTKTALPFSPFSSPYEAFNTFMNVLGDFEERVFAEYPSAIENEELNSLLTTIHNQADEIEHLEEELKSLKNGVGKAKLAEVQRKTAEAVKIKKPEPAKTSKAPALKSKPKPKAKKTSK